MFELTSVFMWFFLGLTSVLGMYKYGGNNTYWAMFALMLFEAVACGYFLNEAIIHYMGLAV